MLLVPNHASCGSQILYDLPENPDDIKYLLHDYYSVWSRRAYPYCEIYKGETIVFSDANRLKRGRRLAVYIRKHKLGRLTSISTVNPGSHNRITTWLWVYNGKKVTP